MEKCDTQNGSRSPVADNLARERWFFAHGPLPGYPDADATETQDERDDYVEIIPVKYRASPREGDQDRNDSGAEYGVSSDIDLS